MKEIAICGIFNDIGGKQSGYMEKLFRHSGVVLYNGGKYDSLPSLIEKEISRYDVVYWFPDIPNNKPKLVGSIKKINPFCSLVISKNNLENKYTQEDLVARALNSRSALLIEFIKKDGRFLGSIYDPLGNVFGSDLVNPNDVYSTTKYRIIELRSFTRIASVKAGDAVDIPNERAFFDLIKQYADTFHNLVHAVNSERLLGNASFRCGRGFPSFKSKNKIFVSRRNIDKRFIDKDGFVAVDCTKCDKVHYYGDNKPSVDTPAQILLYNKYPNIKYMLHSHTYIKDAPYTDKAIPCGAVEEYFHINKMFPDINSINFCVNLKGHGSLIFAGDIEYMKNIPYVARPKPEKI